MNKYKQISNSLVFALAVIALCVFIGQVLKWNCWVNICLYWVVLTIKNICDWKGSNDE